MRSRRPREDFLSEFGCLDILMENFNQLLARQHLVFVFVRRATIGASVLWDAVVSATCKAPAIPANRALACNPLEGT